MNTKYNIEVLNEEGTKVLTSHKNIELDRNSIYFYCMRLKQRYGLRSVSIRWQEVESEAWQQVS